METYSKNIQQLGPRYLYYLCRFLKEDKQNLIMKAETLVRTYGDDITRRNYTNITAVTTELISALEDLQNIDGPSSQIYETIWSKISAVPNRRFVARL